MKNKLLLFVFFIPLAVFVITASVLWHERSTWQQVKVAIQGYDPRDLLSGHYIRYQIDWDATDTSQFGDYADYKNDFGEVDRRTERNFKKNGENVDLPRVCRFYIPQQYADQLQRMFWQQSTNKCVIEVLYAYKPGKPAIAKQLLINGDDWMKYVDMKETNTAREALKRVAW